MLGPTAATSLAGLGALLLGGRVVLRRFFEVGLEQARVAGEVETVVAVGSRHSGVLGGPGGVQGGSRGVLGGGGGRVVCLLC